MNVPQENSPTVNAPTTRSGGGVRLLMSPRWTANSLPKNSFTSRRNPSVPTVRAGAATEDWARTSEDKPLLPANKTRSKTGVRIGLLFNATKRGCGFIRFDTLADNLSANPNHFEVNRVLFGVVVVASD